MRDVRWVAAVVAVLISSAAGVTPAQAQVAWDAPSLIAPGLPGGWGFHLIDADPHGGLGAAITYRRESVPVGLGFRGGIAEDHGDDLAVFAGIDISGPLHRQDGDIPIEVIWFAGGGLGVNQDVLLSFPAGVSVGWAILGDEVSFQPYVAPKVVLDAHFSDESDDELDLLAAIEIGLDLAVRSDLLVRAAASLIDREAVSIGIQIAR